MTGVVAKITNRTKLISFSFPYALLGNISFESRRDFLVDYDDIEAVIIIVSHLL